MRYSYYILLNIIIVVFFSSCGKDKGNESLKACFDKTIDGGIVEFNNDCSEAAEEYLWKFGDGFTTFRSNPTHTYDNAGDFNVTLIVTGSSSSVKDSVTETITIERYSADWTCNYTNGGSGGGSDSGPIQRVEASIESARKNCEDVEGGTFTYNLN